MSIEIDNVGALQRSAASYLPLLISKSKIQVFRAAALLPIKPGCVYGLQVPNLSFWCENSRVCLNRDLKKGILRTSKARDFFA